MMQPVMTVTESDQVVGISATPIGPMHQMMDIRAQGARTSWNTTATITFDDDSTNTIRNDPLGPTEVHRRSRDVVEPTDVTIAREQGGDRSWERTAGCPSADRSAIVIGADVHEHLESLTTFESGDRHRTPNDLHQRISAGDLRRVVTGANERISSFGESGFELGAAIGVETNRCPPPAVVSLAEGHRFIGGGLGCGRVEKFTASDGGELSDGHLAGISRDPLIGPVGHSTGDSHLIEGERTLVECTHEDRQRLGALSNSDNLAGGGG